MVGEDLVKRTEVTTICGIRWVVCSLVMAVARACGELIFVSDRTLELVVR